MDDVRNFWEYKSDFGSVSVTLVVKERFKKKKNYGRE